MEPYSGSIMSVDPWALRTWQIRTKVVLLSKDSALPLGFLDSVRLQLVEGWNVEVPV
jgi:hypothetical protein